jgi:peptide/nickel transport system substrate-binding protein
MRANDGTLCATGTGSDRQGSIGVALSLHERDRIGAIAHRCREWPAGPGAPHARDAPRKETRVTEQRSHPFGRRAMILGVFALVAMLLAPFAATAKQDAATGGTLVGAFDVGPGGAPEQFNPLDAGAGFTWFEKYFSKLMLYDKDFTQIQGELAESWQINEDATQYTITLREGVLWHDGEAFTSEDVKFTIELAAHPEVGSYIGAKFVSVESIETPDDRTVVLNLSAPNATLLDAFTFLVMLPQHALHDIAPADLLNAEWWRTTPIGTGPFKWSRYEPGQFVELVAFEDYWRGRPQLDMIINRYFPEAGSSVIALRAGDISFTYMTTDEALDLQGDPNFTVLEGPSLVVNAFGFDLTDPRFQDKRVRQAFAYAINRQILIDQIFQGTATAVPCAYLLPQYLPAESNAYEQDVEMARTLLTEAGWDTSQSVEIVTYYSDQLSQDVMVTVQQFLSDVGMQVTLRTTDTPGTYNDVVADPAQWDINYFGAANGPDPDVLSTHFQSKASNPSVINRSSIANPELDALFEQGRQTVDPAARAEVYKQICSIMNEEVYWANMWVTTRFGGVSNEVQNFVWTPAPGGGRYYDAAETWSVPAS